MGSPLLEGNLLVVVGVDRQTHQAGSGGEIVKMIAKWGGERLRLSDISYVYSVFDKRSYSRGSLCSHQDLKHMK